LVQDRGGNASVSDTASLQLKVLVIISLKCCVDHTTQTYSCKTTITALSSNKRLVCTRLVASVDLGNMDLAITYSTQESEERSCSIVLANKRGDKIVTAYPQHSTTTLSSNNNTTAMPAFYFIIR
jgi:hypothetical protein